MKKMLITLMTLVLCLSFAHAKNARAEAVQIALSDSGVTVNGQPASTDPTQAVYTANDIVFYLAGQDFTYGEGGEHESHTQEAADAHTVVHITQPGTYVLSGSMSAGQIAVDVKDGKKDPEATVTLVLNGVDITCGVAPAVIFYNVYECGSADAETASMTVDTSSAGANVIIADGTVNTINGSHVARIYKPDSVKLSEDGTKVEEASKLHKYDAAFYSRRSMNVSGGEEGSGVLNIHADNEGLGTELHLTINGGIINIFSGNDGINTNEDNVSVTTINGGSLNIAVNGATGEGDGIDSNGWLVINGGSVISAACGFSGDAGIDSDMGIWINGGEVCATGNMFDHVAGGDQPHAVFAFSERVKGGSAIELKSESGETVQEWKPVNDFSYLVISGPSLQPGAYTLWQDGAQLGHTGANVMAFGGMGGMKPPEMPEGFVKPDGFDPSQPAPQDGMPGSMPPEGFGHGEMPPPEGFDPAGSIPPEGFDPAGSVPPEGFPKRGGERGEPGLGSLNGKQESLFIITEEGGSYSGVSALKTE